MRDEEDKAEGREEVKRKGEGRGRKGKGEGEEETERERMRISRKQASQLLEVDLKP